MTCQKHPNTHNICQWGQAHAFSAFPKLLLYRYLKPSVGLAWLRSDFRYTDEYEDFDAA